MDRWRSFSLSLTIDAFLCFDLNLFLRLHGWEVHERTEADEGEDQSRVGILLAGLATLSEHLFELEQQIIVDICVGAVGHHVNKAGNAFLTLLELV